MKKKIVNIIMIIVLLVNILIINTNFIYATTQSSKIDTGDYEPTDLKDSDYQTAFDMASTIVRVITVIGIVISIISVIYLGMRYMYGSTEERAEYKKTMGPMLIGAILLFSSSTIISIIYELVKRL